MLIASWLRAHIKLVVERELDVGNAGVLHEAGRLVEGVHVAGFGQPEKKSDKIEIEPIEEG